MLTAAESAVANDHATGYRTAGSRGTLVNKQGWKVCHISAVGLGTALRKSTELSDYEARFARLIRPCNMFLVPKRHAGIGELAPVIAAALGRRIEHLHEP